METGWDHKILGGCPKPSLLPLIDGADWFTRGQEWILAKGFWQYLAFRHIFSDIYHRLYLGSWGWGWDEPPIVWKIWCLGETWGRKSGMMDRMNKGPGAQGKHWLLSLNMKHTLLASLPANPKVCVCFHKKGRKHYNSNISVNLAVVSFHLMEENTRRRRVSFPHREEWGVSAAWA